MTTPAELRALAERVMKLQGPCREADRRIDHTRFTSPPHYLELSLRDKWDVPHFTASLDAAVAQIAALNGPFIAQMGDIAADGLPGVCLCISTDPVKEVWGICLGGGSDHVGRLARAATAAALLARAAMMEDAP